MENEQNQRVKLVMEKKEFRSAASFARAIGVTDQTIRDIVKGKENAGDKVIRGILNAFPDIDETWLRYGRKTKKFSWEAEEPDPEYEELYHIKSLVQKVIEIDEKVQNLEYRVGKLEQKDKDVTD